MFKNIESKSMSQKIVEQIQDMIMEGDLKQGSVLPSERELADTFGVGRPTLREALKSLEVMGIISSKHGSGNVIVNNVNQKFNVPRSLSFKMSGKDPLEILQFRQMVEFFIVAEAAEIATDEDIMELYSIEEELEASKQQKDISRADRKFHQRIAEIINNSLIMDTLENASFLLNTFSEETIHLLSLPGDSPEQLYREHRNIIRAIEEHDRNKALAAIQYHLRMIDISKIK